MEDAHDQIALDEEEVLEALNPYRKKEEMPVVQSAREKQELMLAEIRRQNQEKQAREAKEKAKRDSKLDKRRAAYQRKKAERIALQERALQRSREDTHQHLRTLDSLNLLQAALDHELTTNLPKEKPSLPLPEDRQGIRVCSICCDAVANVCLVPCGHIVTCIPCVHTLSRNLEARPSKIACPVCRMLVNKAIETF